MRQAELDQAKRSSSQPPRSRTLLRGADGRTVGLSPGPWQLGAPVGPRSSSGKLFASGNSALPPYGDSPSVADTAVF